MKKLKESVVAQGHSRLSFRALCTGGKKETQTNGGGVARGVSNPNSDVASAVFSDPLKKVCHC